MTFDEVLAQVQALLRREKRVSYRGLKRRFALDDEYLEDLKEELIGAKQLATDEDGHFLVWTGGQEPAAFLPDVSYPQPPAPTDLRPAEAERRQLTVQFIDLVGSTTLSQQLDPEDYHARVVAYQTVCHQVIARYEGHIAQYLGDGVLVYFGYPVAHEDDAVRAVRSGLEIIIAVSQLPFTLSLQVRIGIHTGPVVVGEIGAGERTERLALGETPNIAARVQSQAAPNSVVISQATYRLVQGFFTCEGLGPQSLKNVATPLDLYRVQGEGEANTRFEVSVQKGLTPLVGRESELGLLRQRWEQATEGEGQIVLLSGEPGIGKSRLVQEFKEQFAYEGVTRIEFRCSTYHQNSALYPIIDHLQRLLQFAREDSPAVKLEKLQHTLSHYRFPQADTVPLLAALLSLPRPEGYSPITVSPQKQKEKTQAALVAWLVEDTKQAAVFCAWEDLHWADPSTLEVLTLLLDQAPTTRLLIMLTFRPEFLPPWGNRSHLSQITLSRLGRQYVETMVENVTHGKTLPAEVVQQIVAKTDGVPLFVEELTKTVVESVGATQGSPLQLSIPATLHDSLMARLDRLGAAKEIAQVGAVLGREFSYELIHAVSSEDEATLQRGLKQLVEVELLYQRGLPPHATYLFKHALIQDTAYHSLLKSRRQQLHQQIAQILEEQFPDTTETQPELLAHHYTEAGLIAQALPYWHKAGERATQHSAYVEAISYFTKALQLFKPLPDTPERAQQELTLQIALAAPLIATKGYTAPEVKRVYTRLRELGQQLGETSQLFWALQGLWVLHLQRAEYQMAREVAEQGLSLAKSVDNPTFLMRAHLLLGDTLFWLGEIALAREHLEEGIALYDPQQHRSDGAVEDPEVTCLCYASRVLWALGYADQALRRNQEALTLAQELSRPYSVAYALDAAALLYQFRREVQLARERAEAEIALSTKQEFPHWLALGTIWRGWGLVEQGQGEEGIAQMCQGMAAWWAMGAELGRPYFLARLAEAYGKGGKVEKGLTVLAEATAAVDKTEERVWEAELYRLKGTLTLQSKVQSPESQVEEEAEEYFLKAIDIARQQQAKSLELRAATSLARLWQQQGKQREAHHLLSDIYNWFTEGFDTKDLQEAKALLDELARDA